MNFSKDDLDKLQEKSKFPIEIALLKDMLEMGEMEKDMFLKCMIGYIESGEIPNFTDKKYRFISTIFRRFRENYDSDSSKWLKSCKRKSEAKKADWQKKKTDKFGNPLEHPIYK